MKSFFLAFALLFSIPALATPAEVLILRHAEKPDDDNKPYLSQRGYRRAQALIELFSPTVKAHFLEAPAAIYAASPKKKKGSMRSIETVMPLSRKLGISPHIQFSADDSKAMTRQILSDPNLHGKTVLICWPHEEIKDVAQFLGVKDDLKKWKDSVYDRIWRIRYQGSHVASFDDLPQDLLKGDSKD